MQLDLRRKIRSIKWLALRELVISLAFFACYTGFLTIIVESMRGVRPDFSWRIVLLICALGLLFASRFETHLITPDEGRFLGYKAYIFLYYKVLYLGLGALATYLVCLGSADYRYFALTNIIFALVYYAALIVLTFKYRKYFLNGKVYVTYLQSVKEWWKEGDPGEVPPPAPKPAKPPKEPKAPRVKGVKKEDEQVTEQATEQAVEPAPDNANEQETEQVEEPAPDITDEQAEVSASEV